VGVMEIVLSYTSLLAHFGNGSTKEILLFTLLSTLSISVYGPHALRP